VAPAAISEARAAAAKLYSTIDRVPDIDSSMQDGHKPDTVTGNIELQNVDFNYPSRPDVPIVKNLNLNFAAGKTAALVGASGSGKSTVIALIERFYDPLAGGVKLDGRDLRTLNVKWLRSQIGLVSQEPTLFATTIRDNIEHGLISTAHEHAPPEKKMELVREAAVKANADGFISRLPRGYDTLVGERGFLLSGGQKQRIAIARAIVSDPRILLLDEATSALDTQSEGVVQAALDRAAAGRTTITIAHRLSTVKDVDCIYVMGGGIVLEQGRHYELLQNKDGAYAKLVEAQKLRGSVGTGQGATMGDDDGVAVVDGSGEADCKTHADKNDLLGRSDTHQSLASAILEKHNQDQVEGNYSLYYVFKRVGYINRAQWKRYVLGTIFGICMSSPCFF
jgi:ATP-binding cassette subfamily B (MDR/TAP) protein 1